jgi:hypothetical protein
VLVAFASLIGERAPRETARPPQPGLETSPLCSAVSSRLFPPSCGLAPQRLRLRGLLPPGDRGKDRDRKPPATGVPSRRERGPPRKLSFHFTAASGKTSSPPATMRLARKLGADEEEPLGLPGRCISAGWWWFPPSPSVIHLSGEIDPGPISVPGSSLAQPHPARKNNHRRVYPDACNNPTANNLRSGASGNPHSP